MQGNRLLKKLTAFLAFTLVLLSNNLFSQSASVSIVNNAGVSQNVPLGSAEYSVSESIYTAAEIGAATFGSNSINHIDFSPFFTDQTTAFSSVRIYMKNIPAATTAFTGSATYSITGYTLVYNGTVNYADTGFSGVNITPFAYVSAGNLQIMVVKADGVAHPSSYFNTANGNNLSATATSCRRYNSTAAITAATTLAASAFRPAVRLSYIATGAPPLCATGVIPEDGSIDQATNPNIAWTAAVGATSYDIYLGTTTPAPFVVNQTAIHYTPPVLLSANTKYYFKVVAKNSSGAAIGCAEQSFTTGASYFYCLPFYLTGCGIGDAISLFKLGDINNTSTCSDNAYNDFTYLSTNLKQGSGYPFTVNQGDPGDYVKIWIDYNNNGSFDDAGELVFGTANNLGTDITGTINIPADAPIGNHLLRIRNAYGVSDFTACSDEDYGETEDYVVTIISLTATDAALTDITMSGCQGAGIINVTLKNTGAVTIPTGVANVKLYTTGANPQGPLSQSNPAPLAAGEAVVLSYEADFTNIGENIDSAFIDKIAGDISANNDSILTGHLTVGIVNAPLAEDFEGSVDGWSLTPLSSNITADDLTWYLADTLIYPSYSPPGDNPTEYGLLPKSGLTAIAFDSYDLSAGSAVRLSSPCINIPANANTGCGYVTGFYFAQDPQYSNPDSIVVQITTNDGNYTRLGVVYRFDSTLSTPFEAVPYSPPGWKLYTFDIAAYAGQTVQIAFDAYSQFGNQMAIDSFFIGPKTTTKNVTLAGGNESGVTLSRAIVGCDDKGWTYYHTANSADYLFGIQWDPSSTGANAAAKAAATAMLNINPIWYAAEDAANLKATYTLQRYWDVNLNGAALTGAVNVRFFYSQKELDSMNLAKSNFMVANPGSVDKGFSWFKKNSGSFVPATDVTADGVAGTTTLTNTNTIGSTINGVLYAQFNGITSFSGGTAATGVGSTPTAVTYTFTGTGNWSLAGNWSNNTVPPGTLPAGSSIVINHSVGGQCVLNVTQNIAAGASFTVLTGKNLIIPGQLNVQ